MRFGEILIEAGFCSPRQIWSALEFADYKQLPIGTVLRMQQIIDDNTLEIVLAAQQSIREGVHSSTAVTAVREALNQNQSYKTALSQLGVKPKSALPVPGQLADKLGALSSKTKAQINSMSLLTKGDKALRDNLPHLAHDHFNQALIELEVIHGKDSPDLDVALTKLANFYLATNKLNDAEVLYTRILNIRKNHFGVTSTAYAAACENLCDLALARKNETMAEAFITEAMAIREAQPNLEFDGYVRALKRLQVLFANRKPDPKLLRLGRMVLDWGIISQDNLNTALSVSGTMQIPLGNVFLSKGLISKSDLRSVLAAQLLIKEKKLAYPVAMNLLKVCHQRQVLMNDLLKQIAFFGESADSEEFKKLVRLRERLQDVEETWGPMHLDVALAVVALADAHIQRGDFLDAEMLCRRGLMILKRVNGGPQLLADVGHRLADLLLKTNRIEEAKVELIDALENYRHVGPAANSVCAGLLQQLAQIEYQQDNMTIAAEYLSKEFAVLLKGQSAALLPADDLRWMTDCLMRADSANYAEGVLLKQTESARSRFGETNPELGAYLELLGDFYSRSQASTKAETQYTSALNIFDQSYGPNHPRVVELIRKLQQVTTPAQHNGQK